MTQQQILDILKVGQTWQSKRTGENFTISRIVLNQWHGYYEAHFTDNSYVNIHHLVKNAVMVTN